LYFTGPTNKRGRLEGASPRQYGIRLVCGRSSHVIPISSSHLQVLRVNPVAATTSDAGTRRDFLYVAAGPIGAVGVAVAAWPFIDQMNPSAAALALGSTEIDLTAIQPGQQIVYKWRGQPLFVRRRTPAEIESAKAVDVNSLPDPLARNANLPDNA